MHTLHRYLALPLLAFSGVLQGFAAPADVSFSRDIQPIFEASCVQCHGHGRAKGGFRIDTRETLLQEGHSGVAVVPGKADQSLLVKLVTSDDPDEVMPKKGKRLTAEQVSTLKTWINQGLPWDAEVSFALPAPRNLDPRRPEVAALGSDQNPIDTILRRYFATNGTPTGGVVSDRVFARRVFLDTIGLLPSPKELEAFVSDTAPDKRAKLVRELLGNDRAYAEHWLTFWNDLLRNDYRGTGYIDGGRKQITPWLYSALLTNMPYDRFVAQLVNPVPESEGFAHGIVWRGVVNASQTPEMQAAQNIAQVFMGVNLKCASCHDSFINNWRLSDAYGLASVYGNGHQEMFQCDKPTGQEAKAQFIYPDLGQIDAAAEKPARLKQLEDILVGPKNGRLSRTVVNRLWAVFFGRGLVEPLDDMEQKAWNSDLLDWLAEDLVEHKYDLKWTMARILTSRAYQLPAVDLGEGSAKNFVFRGPAIRRMSAEQFRDALGQVAGVWPENSEVPGVTNRVRASLVAADPLSTALGRPNREQVVSSRPTVATTLQSLELTNGETLSRLLRQAAETLAGSGTAPEPLVEGIYLSALGRGPTAGEKELARSMVGQPVRREGVEDLLWVTAMLPEFQLIY